jgi:hypothetical protein
MVRKLLGVALLALNAFACSSRPIDTQGDGASEAQVGSLNLPLTSKTGDITYRLNKATFTIVGPALGGKPRVVRPPADEAIHHEVLPIGSYSIELEDGWVLEKLGADGKTFSAVPATLITDNPLKFEVTSHGPADAFFGFSTVSGNVTLGKGSVNIRIGVEDCSYFDRLMANLGELTADCMGSVDPRFYEVVEGVIRPTFSECKVDPTRLLPIKQLLALQSRTAVLPNVRECMGARFEVAQQQFFNSGVEVCPSWTDKVVLNEITSDTIKEVSSMLPEPGPDDVRPPDRVFEMLKQQSAYTLTFNGQQPSQQCEGPGRCATVCAGSFPGLIVSIDTDRVITDPDSWWVDTLYPTRPDDPFAPPSFYHPMSYALPTSPPGQIYGSLSRFQVCTASTCLPEYCSYWTGASHLKRRLQMYCDNYNDISTCNSFCGPQLPPPP